MFHLGVQTGPPYCYLVLFALPMTHPLLPWKLMQSREGAHSCHHGQTDDSGGDRLCLPHQRQLMSCGTMDQPIMMEE